MPFTHEMELPSYEELEVTEVNLSMAALFAAALHLGKKCSFENNEFMLCRKETDDPRQCLKEGKNVTTCALDFFQKIKKECSKEFDAYAKCLHKGSRDWSFMRQTQAVFDKCALNKLGIEKPEIGWNSEVKIHRTEREKPENEPLVFPGTADKYTPAEKLKEPKFPIRPTYP